MRSTPIICWRLPFFLLISRSNHLTPTCYPRLVESWKLRGQSACTAFIIKYKGLNFPRLSQIRIGHYKFLTWAFKTLVIQFSVLFAICPMHVRRSGLRRIDYVALWSVGSQTFVNSFSLFDGRLTPPPPSPTPNMSGISHNRLYFSFTSFGAVLRVCYEYFTQTGLNLVTMNRFHCCDAEQCGQYLMYTFFIPFFHWHLHCSKNTVLFFTEFFYFVLNFSWKELKFIQSIVIGHMFS